VSEQEEYWRGDLGDLYISRNQSDELLAAKKKIFAKILSRTVGVNSVLEFGCNIGLNLLAIRNYDNMINVEGVEINSSAVEIGRESKLTINHKSVLDFTPTQKYDLCLTAGFLIHVNPDSLPKIYRKIYEASAKYILIYEYYDPTPTMINYRGLEDRLWKRDFAGEMLDSFSSLSLEDYGFVYRRDPVAPDGDMSWFLLCKE